MTTTSDTLWEIPEPLSTSDVRVDDDTVITLRRHGNPAGPRLVLSHGNGLAIDLYYPFWSLLLDDFDLVIYDLRNHGWNAVSSREKHNVPTFVSDHDRILEAIDRDYGKKPKIGVFHSVAALTTLMSPTKGRGFSAYVLFDPPLCKRGASYEEFDAAAERLAAMIRRRAHRFRNREQLTEVLSFVPTFQRTVPGFFDLMARTTLRPNVRMERGMSFAARENSRRRSRNMRLPYAVLVDFAAFHCPIKVIGADPTLPYSYLPTLDLSHILTVDYDFLPETTHLLQVEQPEECVAELREFVERNARL